MSGPSPKSAPKPVTDLSVRFCGIELKNPLIAASGTFGYGLEFEDVVQLDKLGGFVVKGLSREPITGNPPPRLFETAAGSFEKLTPTYSGSACGKAPTHTPFTLVRELKVGEHRLFCFLFDKGW